jgi:large subunit ribosomal protein L18
MKPKRKNAPLKRKKQGKTNYKKRLRLLLSGKHRLIIRPFLNNVSAQIVDYSPEGDKVVAAATARDVEKLGWKFNKGNMPSAYLTGLLAGKKAVEKGVKEAILDVGLRNPTKGSKAFACLKGAIDAGLNIPYSKEELPSDDKISGKDIADYAGKLKSEKEKYEKQFSKCIKQGQDPSEITKAFEEVKNKIKVKP